MNRPSFRALSFPVEGSDKIACVIAGYRGKITRYKRIIQALNERGFTVIGYEHDPSVLASGDPQDFINLVDGICNDFAAKAADHKRVICVGASLGAGIGFALQRRLPMVHYGIYTVAGAPGKDAYRAPLFYFVRRKFKKHGFNLAKLTSLWQEFDISPDDPPKRIMPFVMVLGKRDVLNRYEKAFAALTSWQKAGVPIKIINRPNSGHIRTIGWYKKHIGELLTEAEHLTSRS